MGAPFFRWLGLAGQLLLTSAVLAGGGYLARVGPKHLRFAEPPARRNPETVLAPLQMSEPSPDQGEQARPVAPVTPRKNETNDVEIIGPVPMQGPEVNETMPATPRQTTPEALLQFFNPSTQRGTVISTPVEFTPPAPDSQRSSSATYISK